MYRAILTAWFPLLIALVASFVFARLLLVLAGGRLRLSRLKKINRCEEGSVQSLSFVITMPILLMITLFIVQVSQLMIGIVVVNYSAFAAARSAAVWIPARTAISENLELENDLPVGASPDRPIILSTENPEVMTSYKYHQIWKAASLACLPICPSRDTASPTNLMIDSTASSLAMFYDRLVPSSSNNSKIPLRLKNKLAYSFNNTIVRLEFFDKDSVKGPTYNPVETVITEDGTAASLWHSNEVGWQDPLRITVTHQYALLPGPGRFLAKFLVRADGNPDTISSQIQEESGVYKTAIWASATITNEGFKSLVPYVQTSQ
ncbi:hypothetical protein MNBD_PLANCTO02-2470 [hydrothermal vent metagenome]|uniref:Uncharacterized protein n=1 Tax=hydrothermal vent metagenome TaxID=652676 RepID=A0A3B1DHE9_9ZZZZ